jgi:hypothetical protein
MEPFQTQTEASRPWKNENITCYCAIVNHAVEMTKAENNVASSIVNAKRMNHSQFNIAKVYSYADLGNKTKSGANHYDAAGFYALSLCIEETCRGILAGVVYNLHPKEKIWADKLLHKCLFVAYAAGTKNTLGLDCGYSGPSVETLMRDDAQSTYDNLLSRADRFLDGEFLPNPGSGAVKLFDIGCNAAPVQVDTSLMILNENAQATLESTLKANCSIARDYNGRQYKYGDLLSRFIQEQELPADSCTGLRVHIVSKALCIGIVWRLDTKSEKVLVGFVSPQCTLPNRRPACWWASPSDLRLVIPQEGEPVLAFSAGTSGRLVIRRGEADSINQTSALTTILVFENDEQHIKEYSINAVGSMQHVDNSVDILQGDATGHAENSLTDHLAPSPGETSTVATTPPPTPHPTPLGMPKTHPQDRGLSQACSPTLQGWLTMEICATYCLLCNFSFRAVRLSQGSLAPARSLPVIRLGLLQLQSRPWVLP